MEPHTAKRVSVFASPSRGLVAFVVIAAACAAATGQAQQPDGADASAPGATCPPASGFLGFAERSKRPLPWLKLGGDLRIRENWEDNAFSGNRKTSGHEYHYQQYRFRLWATVTAIENIDLNTRLVFEPRRFIRPKSSRNWRYEEGLFDNLNVKWANFLGLPLTVTAGRQDLRFTDGWLVLDGTPKDGPRTIFFDAVRLTWKLDEYKTKIDLVGLDQKGKADGHIEPFCNKDELLSEEDSAGVIVHVANTSLPNTEIDGYYIFKRDRAIGGVSGGNDAEIHTIGGRAAGRVSKYWDYRAELAVQVGDVNDQDLCALGFNGRLCYSSGDRFANCFHVDYEYASGDDPGTSGQTEQFNRLWGRWPRFSAIIIKSYTSETRIAEITNLHRIGLGWSCTPAKPFELHADYHLLFSDTNAARGRAGFSDSGSFRGQLATLLCRYKFSAHVAGHALGEAFFPGDYYDSTKNDPAYLLRYELVLSW